jgi:hypothetical protein
MRKSRPLLCALLGAAIAGCAMVPLSPATAAVQQGPSPSSEAVQQFLANPSAWMAQFPNGGAPMIAAVRSLGSDPATLKAIVGLLATANTEQSTAIGTGLGQVAVMAVKTDQKFATDIQTAVVTAQNESALVAFKSVVGGDLQLTAAAGTTGGAGGGGESSTVGSSGLGGFFAGNPENFPTSAGSKGDDFPGPSFSTGSPGTLFSPISP